MAVVLRKKLEQLESRVSILSQNPPDHLTIYQVGAKIKYIRNLLAAETESSSPSKSQDNLENLEEFANRLSVAQKNFTGWADNNVKASSEDKSETPEETAERLSFIESNFSYLNTSEEEEEAEEAKETVTTSVTEEEEETVTTNVAEEEEEEEVKIGGRLDDMVLSEENIERIAAKVTEKVKEREKRRGGWSRFARAVVLVAALGVVMAGFGPVEEPVYLVPT